jgi:hypothetical protein
MVTNRFGNRNFMQPMGRLRVGGGLIFFFGRRGIFVGVPNVFPKMFSSGSQNAPKVPHVFFKDVPQ